MVNGRQNLNEILSKAGIASKEQLENIFAKGKTHGVITISTFQKKELKDMLTGVTSPETKSGALTENEAKLTSEMSKSLSFDRSSLKDRYSLKDFVFSPEISSLFKEHLKTEFSVENMDFLQDLKSSLNPPQKEKLTQIYNKYLKTGSEQEINIGFKTRLDAKNLFESKNGEPSLEDMLKVMNTSSKEILGLLRDSFSRFKGEPISKAILTDALHQPDSLIGNKRLDYIDSIIKEHKQIVANSPIISHAHSIATIKEAQTAKFITLNPIQD